MADNNEQFELEFPDPDDFESYDEVESDEGQAELPEDSFDEAAASDNEEGCACSK